MTEAPNIVIVEDDPVSRKTLAGYFEAQGYRVTETESAEEMEEVLANDAADLLIIDINLPGKDGLEITREQRAKSEIGIILLTGRKDDVDRIVGLELGADDYVTKPFNRRELLVRVKNLLRRTEGVRRASDSIWRFDGWTFDATRRHLLSPEQEAVSLTRGEYELLKVFLAHRGEVLSRERLMSAITHRRWESNDRTVDVLVRRLRKKLQQEACGPEMIVTAHGEGYVFVATTG